MNCYFLKISLWFSIVNVWIDVHLVLFSAEAILRQSSFERGGYGVILLLMVEFLIKTGLIIVITIQAIGL